MKKIVGILLIFVGLFIASCEEPEPPMPDCEKYNTGSVVVYNMTGYSLKVDVTESGEDVNYEKWVTNGDRTSYPRIEAGSIRLWASFDGDDWVYDTYYLSACEDLTYTWYLNKKKSTESGLYVEIAKDGVVIKTVTEFTVGDKQ